MPLPRCRLSDKSCRSRPRFCAQTWLAHSRQLSANRWSNLSKHQARSLSPSGVPGFILEWVDGTTGFYPQSFWLSILTAACRLHCVCGPKCTEWLVDWQSGSTGSQTGASNESATCFCGLFHFILGCLMLTEITSVWSSVGVHWGGESPTVGWSGLKNCHNFLLKFKLVKSKCSRRHDCAPVKICRPLADVDLVHLPTEACILAGRCKWENSIILKWSMPDVQLFQSPNAPVMIVKPLDSNRIGRLGWDWWIDWLCTLLGWPSQANMVGYITKVIGQWCGDNAACRTQTSLRLALVIVTKSIHLPDGDK